MPDKRKLRSRVSPKKLKRGRSNKKDANSTQSKVEKKKEPINVRKNSLIRNKPIKPKTRVNQSKKKGESDLVEEEKPKIIKNSIVEIIVSENNLNLKGKAGRGRKKLPKIATLKKEIERENLDNLQSVQSDLSNSPVGIIGQLGSKFVSLPDRLPCRESEFDFILEQILLAIQDNQGSCLYISGVPGTGKTATIKKVIQMLQAAVDNDEMAPFKFVEINGMAISETNQAYHRLYEGIFEHSTGQAKCTKLLDSYFRNRGENDDPYAIVLLDELDYLINRKQSLVYNFFEWPSLPNSRLIVIAIANTMDLPERVLSNKVASRLGMCRINFAPYTHPQLLEIIQFYLEKNSSIFTNNALELMARKICAISGDARRLLEVAKRAIELAFSTDICKQQEVSCDAISISIVQRAIAEIFSSSSSPKLLRNLSFHQQLFLVCIGNTSKKTGLQEVHLSECIDCHAQFCRLYSVAMLSIAEYIELIKTLNEMKLVYSNVQPVNYALPLCWVSLAVSYDDLSAAFKDEPFMKNLLVAQ